ncbi:MAG: gliding motility lipoprotein GldH [Muribaculaceae bacterium]|nr:gliding motility lipoprotein GldH [Muribaculaceae bacterium]
MNRIPLILLLTTLCLGACYPGHNDFNSFENLPADGWAYGDTISFVTDTLDSIPLTGTLEIAIRHNNLYPYRNLWLEISYPLNGKTNTDTVNMELADVYGRWHGNGFGASYQFATPVKHKVILGPGTRVNVTHVMRVDTLTGVEQLGIRFRKDPR